MNSESLEIHIALQLDDSSTSVDISVILEEDMVPDSSSDMSPELEVSSNVGSQTGPVDEELARDSRNDTDLSSKSQSKVSQSVRKSTEGKLILYFKFPG